MKLIKLPNGEWLNPAFVIAIRKGERCPAGTFGTTSHEIPPRAIIDFGVQPGRFGDRGSVNAICIECADDAARDAMVEQIAEQCRAA